MAEKIALAETKLAVCGRCSFMLKTVKRAGVFVHGFYFVLLYAVVTGRSV